MSGLRSRCSIARLQTFAHLLEHNERFAHLIYGQSFDRKARAETLLAKAAATSATPGKISVEDARAILSDREGYPTSINRYPNDHPSTG